MDGKIYKCSIKKMFLGMISTILRVFWIYLGIFWMYEYFRYGNLSGDKSFGYVFGLTAITAVLYCFVWNCITLTITSDGSLVKKNILGIKREYFFSEYSFACRAKEIRFRHIHIFNVYFLYAKSEDKTKTIACRYIDDNDFDELFNELAKHGAASYRMSDEEAAPYARTDYENELTRNGFFYLSPEKYFEPFAKIYKRASVAICAVDVFLGMLCSFISAERYGDNSSAVAVCLIMTVFTALVFAGTVALTANNMKRKFPSEIEVTDNGIRVDDRIFDRDSIINVRIIKAKGSAVSSIIITTAAFVKQYFLGRSYYPDPKCVFDRYDELFEAVRGLIGYRAEYITPDAKAQPYNVHANPATPRNTVGAKPPVYSGDCIKFKGSYYTVGFFHIPPIMLIRIIMLAFWILVEAVGMKNYISEMFEVAISETVLDMFLFTVILFFIAALCYLPFGLIHHALTKKYPKRILIYPDRLMLGKKLFRKNDISSVIFCYSIDSFTMRVISGGKEFFYLLGNGRSPYANAQKLFDEMHGWLGSAVTWDEKVL